MLQLDSNGIVVETISNCIWKSSCEGEVLKCQSQKSKKGAAVEFCFSG